MSWRAKGIYLSDYRACSLVRQVWCALAVAASDPAEALRAYQQAVSVLAEHPVRQAEPLCALAQWMLAQGRLHEAEDLLQVASVPRSLRTFLSAASLPRLP